MGLFLYDPQNEESNNKDTFTPYNFFLGLRGEFPNFIKNSFAFMADHSSFNLTYSNRVIYVYLKNAP